MAFRRGKGLRYFPLVTDFFQDRDIRRLVYKCGQKGVLLYIYILCALYAQGYALKWDEDILQDAAVDLQSNTNELQEVLDYLLEKGLFDRGIFDSHGVLTSKAVQRQFQDCARVMRRKFQVESDWWLLDGEETNANIVFNCAIEGLDCTKEGSDCAIKGSDCTKQGSKCENSTQRKGKEKENKNKLNESKGEGEETDCHVASLLAMTGPEGLGKEQGSADLLTHYREKIDLTARAEEELGRYRAELGEELCRHALQRALEMDKPLWSYVRAILKSYSASGYRELNQALEEEQRYKESYGLSGRNVRASCRYPPVDMEKLGEIYKRI